ncbi:DUF4384 domain-containing protein [Persephonella sp.]
MGKLLLLITVFILSVEFVFGDIVKITTENCGLSVKSVKEKNLESSKLKAVEEYVENFIESRTLIINGKLISDIVRRTSLAKIKLINREEIDRFFKGDSVCLKETFTYKLKKKDILRANFGLQVYLPKKEFRKGEEFSLKIYTKKRCYPYIFIRDSRNNVYRIYPNRFEEIKAVQGYFEIPTQNMKQSGITLIAYPYEEDKNEYEEFFVICLKSPEPVLEDLFPEPYAETKDDINLFLRKRYLKVKIDELYKILNNIGIENYEISSDVYKIN